MLQRLWEKHPPARDPRQVAQYIIKASSVSFTGRSIDSIIFKEEALSLKIKRMAMNLLRSMAIMIQKNVRRYLVLRTSPRPRASLLRPRVSAAPRTLGEGQLESSAGAGSPARSPPTRGLLLDEAILAQHREMTEVTAAAAAAAEKRERRVAGSGSGSLASRGSPFARLTGAQGEVLDRLAEAPLPLPRSACGRERDASANDSPPGEGPASEVKERSQKLATMKENRAQAKARYWAEQEEAVAQVERDQANVKLRGCLVALSMAAKLKVKAQKARENVLSATTATNQSLEDEQNAAIRALRNAALDRKNSSRADSVENLSLRDYQVAQAREKARRGRETQTSSCDDDSSAGDFFKSRESSRRIAPGDSPAQTSAREEQSKSPTAKQRRDVDQAGSDSLVVASSAGAERAPLWLDDRLPPPRFEEYFSALREGARGDLSADQVMSALAQMHANKFFTHSSLRAQSDAQLVAWVDVLFAAMARCSSDFAVALAGLKVAAMFPFDRFAVPDNRTGYCKILSTLLAPHLDRGDVCAQILQYGAKFTSKKTIQNLDQAVDTEGLEMVLMVLLKHGQSRDAIGNAPGAVSTCLKYVRNLCATGSSHVHERVMAAGVGSCLLKLLVFYRTDEAVVSPVCRSVACLLKRAAYLTSYASEECIQLYILILKTNPMNKTISKAVGLLLVEVYSLHPVACKEGLLRSDLARLLTGLLAAQQEPLQVSRFSLSVVECNLMTASFFITQVAFLRQAFLAAGVVETLRLYQQGQQHFGANTEIVIQRCLKHLSSPRDARHL